MATNLYLTTAFSDVAAAATDQRRLALARGSTSTASDATATVTGPTSGVQIKIGSVVACWISPPLARVVLNSSNAVTFNIRGSESAAQANAGFDVLIERCNGEGVVQSTIVRSERGTEMATSEGVNNWTAAPTTTTLSDGDRIKVTIFGNDAGGTMASGRTFTLNYNGPTAAASGDTYVSFVETIAPFMQDEAGFDAYRWERPIQGMPAATVRGFEHWRRDSPPLALIDSTIRKALTAVVRADFPYYMEV